MKRLATLLLASMLTLTTLTGCGGDKEKYFDMDGIEVTLEEYEELIELGLIVFEDDELEPVIDGNTMRISKRGITRMVSGYGVDYDGVPMTFLAWRDHNGKFKVIPDVDFENSTKLDLNIDVSAGTQIKFHELDYKDRNGMLEINLKQLDKIMDDYIAIIMQ